MWPKNNQFLTKSIDNTISISIRKYADRGQLVSNNKNHLHAFNITEYKKRFLEYNVIPNYPCKAFTSHGAIMN